MWLVAVVERGRSESPKKGVGNRKKWRANVGRVVLGERSGGGYWLRTVVDGRLAGCCGRGETENLN